MSDHPSVDVDVLRVAHTKRRWPWVLLAVLGVLALAFVTTLFVPRRNENAERARIPAGGPPTPEEFDAYSGSGL